MVNDASIGLAGLGYALPARKIPVEQLQDDGRLVSPAALLRSYGFEYCHVQESQEGVTELALSSAKQAMSASGHTADEISRVFLYSGVAAEAHLETGKTLELFKYPVAELQHRLNLSQANALAVSQQGCSGLLSVLEMARALLSAPTSAPAQSILCVAADCLPRWSTREILYNIVSDATAAVVVSGNCRRNRIVHFHQQVQSYYWNTPLHEEELLASYFPIAQRVIEAALKGADLGLNDLRWIVPHNVSLRSWQILARILDFPMDRIWTQNIARVGHTVSCDHIINLVDMERSGAVQEGDYLLLFTFGFGASWSALVIQH